MPFARFCSEPESRQKRCLTGPEGPTTGPDPAAQLPAQPVPAVVLWGRPVAVVDCNSGNGGTRGHERAQRRSPIRQPPWVTWGVLHQLEGWSVLIWEKSSCSAELCSVDMIA